MKPQTAQLLTRLEIGTHKTRVREMIALGRRAAASDPAAIETLSELERGGFYERMLALFAAHGTRSGDTVVRFLADASALLRGLAAGLVSVLCSEAQISSAIAATTRRGRVNLLRDLRKRRRYAPIDAFVRAQIAAGSETGSELLSFCSADFVREHLPQVAERFSPTDWGRLSRAHPDIAATAMQTYLAAQTGPNSRLVWQLNAVLAPLAAPRPAVALSLIRQSLRHEAANALYLGVLPSYLPNEVADLLFTTRERFPVTLTASQVRRLTPERFLALLSDRPEHLPYPQEYLPHLAPALREQAFALAGESWKTEEGIIAPGAVSALPAALRVGEGWRHLALPALQTRPLSRLPYAAFLPPAEAQTVLEPFIKNPDADLRGIALSTRIGTARYFPETLGDILQTVRRRENEQDPVRRALLQALRELPPSRWQAHHLPDLGQIVRDALNAADLSYATAGEAEQLVVSLIPFHPVWAAQWLSVLVKERGRVSLWGLESRLTDVDMKTVAPALLPVLKAWATRERENQLVSAVIGFGRRVRVFPEVRETLSGVVRSTKNSGVVSSILNLFREHFPEAFAVLVPELINSDKSIGTLPTVYNFLHRCRQDLLAPLLGRTAFGGRFSTGKTRFVLPLLSGFERWTPMQQHTFAQTLIELTQDTERDTYGIGTAIAQLAALPAVEPTRLLELAQVGSGKTAVRDLAVQALARLDGGQGIPALVDALSDNRARVAIYALRSALLEMPPETAFATLQNAPTDKVTVAKEVLRLVGELRLPTVLPYLLAQAARPLHRDVRVALLRALWEFLESADAQSVLLSAASDPDPAVASGVIRVPADRLTDDAAKFLRTLLATLLAHPDAAVRVETLQRCASLPLADPDRVMFPCLVARLNAPATDETVAAATAVFATYNERDADAIGAAIRALLPNRAAFVAAWSVILPRATSDRYRSPRTVNALLNELIADPLAAQYAAILAVAGLSGADAAIALPRIALHPEALMSAVITASGSPLAEAVQLEAALQKSPDAPLRRIAFAALMAQARYKGWGTTLRKRHAMYCRDASPLVAAAAQFAVLPPAESVTG